MLSSHKSKGNASKGEHSADDNQHGTFAHAATWGHFETPTDQVNSCADRLQTPPGPQTPILATLASTSEQGFQSDQRSSPSTDQNLSSFRTDSSPTSSVDSNIAPNTSCQHRARPIPIVCTTADPNRTLTPLTGRAEKEGNEFLTLSKTPSPRGRHVSVGRQQLHHAIDPNSIKHRRRSSSSRLSRSLLLLKMHPDQLGSTRYTPSSPLSPRLPPAGRPVSPQPSRSRTAHRRQPSRNMQLNLGRFHPSNYQSNAQSAIESPASAAQSAGLTYQRMPPQESPRLMRERQRELIDRARMSSKIAASPMGVKPNRPTLAPLGSPKGNVTPLALEENANDYFQVGGAPRVSPAQSPGAISNESSKEFGEELASKISKSDGLR